MYNTSLNNNFIPYTRKLENIIPIPKPKPNKDMNIDTSYRSISLLSVISITLEKTLLPYITKNIPHISTQHGFKSNHSTSISLHNINNTIATGFNQIKPPERTITVALYMSKAFEQSTCTHSHINYIKQTSYTPLSNTSQTTSNAAKYAPHSETKHKHSVNSKTVFHKAACYQQPSSTYAHLTLQHHRHK